MKITTKLFSSLNYRSIILGSVIFASVLAFLFTGFGRFQVFNFKKMDPNTALIVGKQKVDIVEFSNTLRAKGFSSSMPEDQKKYFAFQVLNQLIDQKLMLEIADNMGFVANQASIAAFIRSIPAFADPKTGQFSYERVKQYLSSQEISEIEFFQSLKNELSIQNISELMFMDNPYPKALVQDEYIVKNTAFRLQYANLTLPVGVLQQKAKAQVNAFLNTPENEAVLKEEYEEKKSLHNQPAQYKVNSILVAHKDSIRAQGSALQRSKEDAQKKADETLGKIAKGATFSKVSSQINDDSAAKNNSGSLGFIDETSIDSSSYAAISQLTLQKPLSSVVETTYGFRIFQLEDKKDAIVKTYDDLKALLAENLILEKLKNSAQSEFNNKVRASLLKSKDLPSIDKLLAEENVSWKAIDTPYTVSEKFLPALGSVDQLAANVFVLKKPGDVIPTILSFGSEKNVIIKLVSVRKPDAPSASEIDNLQKQMSNEQSQTLFQSYIKDMRENYEKRDKIKMNQDLI